MKSKIWTLAALILVLVVACWASTKYQNILIQNSTFTNLGFASFTGNGCVTTNGSGILTETTGTGVGCSPSGGKWDYAEKAGGCVTPENGTCSDTMTFVNGGFADANYIPVCSGANASNGHVIINSITRTSATQVTVFSVNYSTDTGINFGDLFCIAYHP